MKRHSFHLLLLAIITATVFSCTDGNEENIQEPGTIDGTTNVNFTLSVPMTTVPETRAMSDAQEQTIQGGVDILAFKVEAGGTETFMYKSVGTLKTGGNNNTKEQTYTASVKIETYSQRFVIIANASADVTEALKTVTVGSTIKEDLLKKLEAKIPNGGKIWPANENGNTTYTPIPMWGETAAQVITANTSLKDIEMLRMLAKINVVVAPTSGDVDAQKNFRLKSVRVYNVNTNGRIAPKANQIGENSDKEKIVTGVSLAETPVSHRGPITYTSSSTTSLEETIYLMETANNNANHLDATCVVIGGYYSADGITFEGTETYYRVNLYKADGKTMKELLRNHRYIINIQKVKGRGHEDFNDAFESKGINMETEIIKWNDGGYTAGVWNGNYLIKFSSLEAHFDHEGNPAKHTIKIVTNVPNLTFEDFKTEGGQIDTNWVPLGQQSQWTNNHFMITLASILGGEKSTEYKLEITAEPTKTGDLERIAKFKIKGDLLEADFTITQDKAPDVTYSLTTAPDPTNKILVDGASPQRIKIDILSSHDYNIVLDPMFTGVWTAQTGGTQITPLTNIPKGTTSVYVAASPHTGAAREGKFTIKHNALEKVYTVTQLTPQLEAVFYWEGKPYANSNMSAPSDPLARDIHVESNLTEWFPQLKKDGTPVTDQTELATYFGGVVKGSGTQNLKFNVPQYPYEYTQNIVYTITFKDANNLIESSAITVTQYPPSMLILNNTLLVDRHVPWTGITRTLTGMGTKNCKVVIYIDNVKQPDASVQNFVTPTTFSTKADLTIKVPKRPVGSGDKDRVIRYALLDVTTNIEKDCFETTQFAPPATSTGLKPTPPQGGYPAVPGVLAVDQYGNLNLDGDGYTVYFAYGSLVAVAYNESTTTFDAKKHFAWAPSEFYNGTENYMQGTGVRAAGIIPHVSLGEPYPSDNSKKASGIGDPCLLASKKGASIGDFKTPEYGLQGLGTITPVADGTAYGAPGMTGYKTQNTDTPFLPTNGYFSWVANMATNIFVGYADQADYWVSDLTVHGDAQKLWLVYPSTTPPGNVTLPWRWNMYPIRCVRK